MSKEYFLSVRAAPPLVDDEYTEDMTELSGRQPPTLSKRLARMAWKEEREFYFFQSLMITSTSYRSDAMDDLRNGHGRKKLDRWYEQVQMEQKQRDKTIAKMQSAIEKHINSLSHGQAERRTEH